MRYETGVANHLGNRRSNQDRFAVIESDEGVLLVLADGMGGHAGGEVAAQALVDIARYRYLHGVRPVPKPGEFLKDIIHVTHAAMVHLANRQNLGHIPGSTAVLCLVQDGRIHWAHVGDSRLYLFRCGLPVVRTTDHSYVEQLYRKGMITRAEQDTHPRRNRITQCIGTLPHPPEVEVGRGKGLHEGDIVLLCSDGLWGALDDAQLGLMLLEHDDGLDAALERMTTRAEQLCYPRSDNISVVALRLTGLSAGAARPAAPARPRPQAAPPPPASPTAVATGVDDEKLKNAIAHIEEALRTYGDELKR